MDADDAVRVAKLQLEPWRRRALEVRRVTEAADCWSVWFDVPGTRGQPRVLPTGIRLEVDKVTGKVSAPEPILWRGDLDDDCSADWVGFGLRAEAMDDDRWWWCVYDHWADDGDAVASSNDDDIRYETGDAARRAAEQAARRRLGLSIGASAGGRYE